MFDRELSALAKRDERLARLFLGFADDSLSETEMAQWGDELARNEELQELFVAACLQRQFLPQVLEELRENEAAAIAPPPPPIISRFGNAWHRTGSFLSDHEYFTGNLVATIFFAVAALIASNVYVSTPEYSQYFSQHAQQRDDSPQFVREYPREEAVQEETIVSVAQITGKVDCVWVDKTTAPAWHKIKVSDKFELKSGLMEITYYTGAKVILQGPCTYEVDSAAGGYLSLGKLTARVEKKGERGEGRGERKAEEAVGSGQWAVASVKEERGEGRGESAKQQENPPSALRLPPSSSPLFAVRTPTAVVTDLGTEFGVEVDGKSGETVSHVFAGKVTLVAIDADGNPHGGEMLLEANQSARVERSGEGAKSRAVVVRMGVVEIAGKMKTLARYMPNSPEGRRDASRAYAELVLSMKPAVYYRMERPKPGENPIQVVDSASSRHDGALNFDAIAFKEGDYSAGRFGDALYFRGNFGQDHVIASDFPKRNGDVLSASAWLYLASRPNAFMPVLCIYREPSSPEHFDFGLNADGNLSINQSLQTPAGERLEVSVMESGEAPFSVGQWRHVAFAVKENEVLLYGNGRMVARQTVGTSVFSSNLQTLGIGGKSFAEGTESFSRYWHGMIDEVALFARPLTPQEIKLLAAGSPGQSSRKSNSSKPAAP